MQKTTKVDTWLYHSTYKYMIGVRRAVGDRPLCTIRWNENTLGGNRICREAIGFMQMDRSEVRTILNKRR